MKPDWDKLGKKYADNSNVMIVDVDCTAAGQGTCQKVGVKGYPVRARESACFALAGSAGCCRAARCRRGQRAADACACVPSRLLAAQTIKYYLPNEKKGKDYQGGRDFDSLASFVESKLNKATCDAVTKKGCAANEIAFLEKHATSTLDEIKEALKGKNDDLKQIRKDKSKAQAEAKQKEREFTKKEKLTQKSIGLLKQLEKAGGAPKKEEL